VYLKYADNRPYDHCWWCDPEYDSGTHQTRDHHFKHYYKWEDRKPAMWVRVKEMAKEGKQKWCVGGGEVQPGCPRLLAKYRRRENGPTDGGNLGQ